MKHAVIMAGGVGSRLWPLSRKKHPKQFQAFIGDKTLLQQTFNRITPSIPTENIWVVTTEDYIELTKEQLPELNPEQIIAEPGARGTAAAVGLTLLTIQQKDPEALIGVFPADHHIGKTDQFTTTLKAIYEFLEAKPEYLCTIGINPTEPNTGLGYIKMGDKLQEIGEQDIFQVDSFHEKPDLKTAQEFLENWEYLWNGGYFFFSAAALWKNYQNLAPAIAAGLDKYMSSNSADDYLIIPNEQIDRAIAEKLDKLAVAPADLNWSDIGNWAALHEILNEAEELGEVRIGNTLLHETKRSMIFGGKKLIATVGLEDVVVIDTEDVTLVCHRERVQDVKKLVEQLQEDKREEYL